MDWTYEISEDMLRILVPQELDHHSAQKLQKETDLLLNSYHIHHLVFDFSRTEFMDSSGIGMLIAKSKWMQYSGGSVEAEHLSARVKKIFTISGLFRLIQIKNEEDEQNGTNQ
ncbi:MAG: anti-sigma factor antagonist [Lachnospiraceae bacterium]